MPASGEQRTIYGQVRARPIVRRVGAGRVLAEFDLIPAARQGSGAHRSDVPRTSIKVTVWGSRTDRLAENVAASYSAGDPVVVVGIDHGRRSFVGARGGRGSEHQMTAHVVAPDLRHAVLTITPEPAPELGTVTPRPNQEL